MADIMILGSGFGSSLAVMLHKYGHSITLWSKFQDEIDEIRLHGEHRRLLPGVAIDTGINLTSDLSLAKDKELILVAVPSTFVRETAIALSKYITPNTVVVNVGKGLEEHSLLRLSEVLEQELTNNKIVVLSGPCHAEEVARGVPTTIVAASKCRESAEYVQEILMNSDFRVYVNNDMLGVELGGALKNIIAVCAGICDGLSLGDNTKAALMTRGLSEIARLGKAMGACDETFVGLTGMGDLIVTCTSMHSRNRRCGILIGQGFDSDEAKKRVGMTVEGCTATCVAHDLSKKYNVEMPITEQLWLVLTKGKDVKIAISDLMERPKRSENEAVWISKK